MGFVDTFEHCLMELLQTSNKRSNIFHINLQIIYVFKDAQIKVPTFNGQLCPNVSKTPITAMGCRQFLPRSVVQLKGKHCQKNHCCNGVVDT